LSTEYVEVACEPIVFEAPPGYTMPLLEVELVSIAVSESEVESAVPIVMPWPLAGVTPVAPGLPPMTLLAMSVTLLVLPEPEPEGWAVVIVKVICAVETLPAPEEPPVAEGSSTPPVPPLTTTAIHLALVTTLPVVQLLDVDGVAEVL
jgi:hypothetical protein